jgi:hypothetical protein
LVRNASRSGGVIASSVRNVSTGETVDRTGMFLGIVSDAGRS